MIADMMGGPLGLETLTKEALYHLTRRRVVLVRGAVGMGRTTALEQIAVAYHTQVGGTPPIILRQLRPYKTAILDAIYQLHRRGCLPQEPQEMTWETLEKILTRAHASKSVALVSVALEAFPVLICVDDLDNAPPLSRSWIDSLAELKNHPPIVATCAQITPLKRLSWRGDVLDLSGLSAAHLPAICAAYTNTSGVVIHNQKDFCTQLFQLSAGNPLSVANALRYCRYDQRISKNTLAGHQILHSPGRAEIDQTWTLILLGVLAIALRYIARGAGDTHLYMLTSVGAAVLVGGRFFLFKGMRKAAD